MKAILVFLILYPLLYLLVQYQYNKPPTSPPLHNFSIERSYEHLVDLTHERKGIGERLFSSIQCEQAHKHLLKYLRELRRGSFTNDQHVDFIIEEQNVSSELFLQVLSYSGMRRYSNVTNVIALLQPKNLKYQNEIILVNSHYDSRISSPGTFDDGIPVVIMMEMIRNMMNEPDLKHPVLFLFNGAEEMGLFGAHAFMQDSPYAERVNAFVNLEAAGYGSRDFLFQSTNAWIMKEYTKVIKHPCGNAVGQDVFQGGIIPSDTDYRFFYGMKKQHIIHGVDSAFIQNGQWYHSYLDSMTTNGVSETEIKQSIQYMADNSGQLIRHLALMDNSFDTSEVSNTRASYFDILNLVMVAYDVQSAKAYYYGLIAIALSILLVQGWKSKQHFLLSLVVSLLTLTLSFVGGVAGSIGTAKIFITALNAQMSWYAASPEYVLVLYGLPAIAFSLLVYLVMILIFGNLISNRSMYGAALIFWSALLLIGSRFNLGSTYLAALTLASLVLGFFCIIPFALTISSLTLPAISFLSLGRTLTISFAGILGRSGNAPVDYTMGGLVGLSASLLALIALPFIRTSPKQLITLLVPLLSIISGLIYLSYMSEPYSVLQPKRLNVRHVMIFDGDKVTRSYLNLRSADPIPPEYVFQKIGYLEHGFAYTNEYKSHMIANIESKNLNDPVFFRAVNNTENSQFFNPDIQTQTESRGDTVRVFTTVNTNKYLVNQRVYVRTARENVVDWSFELAKPSYSEEEGAYFWDLVSGYSRFANEEDNANLPKTQTFWIDVKKGKEAEIQLHVFCHFLDSQIWTTAIKDLLEVLPDWTVTIPVVTSEKIHTLTDSSP